MKMETYIGQKVQEEKVQEILTKQTEEKKRDKQITRFKQRNAREYLNAIQVNTLFQSTHF